MNPVLANILVLDDLRDSLRQSVRLLAAHGYRPRPALTADAALNSAAAEPPDLVLLKPQLSADIDGYEVCARLKAEPSTADVPVIFISASDAAFDKVRAFACGGADFVGKPFEPEELMARIALHLRLHRLQSEVAAHNSHLQSEVARRTADLLNANAELKQMIAENARTEQALKESEHRFRVVVQNSPIVIYVIDRHGVFLLAEGLALPQLGLKPGEVVGRSVFDLFSGYPEMVADLHRVLTGHLWRTESQIGDTIFETVFSPYIGPHGEINGVIGVAVDTTERTRARARLQASVREKEVLLKEIYHRVKNNLQVVVSLLSMQGQGVSDVAVRERFAESADRVRAMVLVHEELYSSADLASIAFDRYLERLIEQLAHQFARPSVRIAKHLEAVTLGLDTAIPCGLLINELISNAFKHAFPGRDDGQIDVELRRGDEGLIRIVVADDGIGLPQDFSPQRGNSLGWRLVSGLVNQIGGTLSFDHRGGGCRIEVRFAEENREISRYRDGL
ncbi:MAG: response regulator [Candidatus Accumulibacter sp.]|nr:response regulator [Accumulibacter sp.]